MKTPEKLVPELRFPEFEGEWKSGVLKDIAILSRGKFTPRPRNDPKYYNGHMPFVQTGDIARSDKYLNSYSQTLNEEGEKVSKVFPPNTILISIAANVGDVAISTFDVACPDSLVGVISTEKSFYSWLYYQLSTRKIELLSYATTNAQANINLEVLRPLKLNYPQKTEQQKIASFLTSIDDKLTKLRRKRELLDQYKRGLMQQLFSQRIRFKQDDGSAFPEWETLKANLLFRNCSNKNHTGDLPILAVTQDKGVVRRDSIDIDIKASLEGVLGYKVIEPGDFVISLRSFQGGIEYSKILGISSPAYTVLKPIKMISNSFYKPLFKKEDFIKRLAATVIGIRDGKQISYGAFSGLKLPYPHPAEQQKIADCLSSFDAKIDAVAQQIQQLDTFKKGLLQKMFV